jgi:hypothetical protein
MQSSFFKKLTEPGYYTAVLDHWSVPGHQEIRSSSLRQVMRFAERFNGNHPPEAEINVYRHANGQDQKLVATRSLADRYWKYV